jgi:hypothetical protein
MLRGRPHVALAIILTFKQFGRHGKSKCRVVRAFSLGFKQLARPLHALLSRRHVVTNSHLACLAAAANVRISSNARDL